MAEPQMELIDRAEEDRLRRDLKRHPLVWEGALGADTEGTLTDEGFDKLMRFLRDEGYGLVRV